MYIYSTNNLLRYVGSFYKFPNTVIYDFVCRYNVFFIRAHVNTKFINNVQKRKSGRNI